MKAGSNTLLGLEALYNARGQQRGALLAELAEGANPEEEAALRAHWRERSFQTHPNLGGYALGAAAAEESAGGWERARTRLAPLFGAIGDRLIYGAMAPAARLLGLCLAVLFLGPIGSWGTGDRASAWVWIPPLTLVLMSALVEAYWRGRSLRVGRNGEQAVADEIAARPWDPWIGALASIARLAAGATLGLVAVRIVHGGALADGGVLIGATLLGIALGATSRFGPIGWAVIALVLAVVAGQFGTPLQTQGGPLP